MILITSKHLRIRSGKVQIELLGGHITSKAGPKLAQVNDFQVLNKSAAREEEEPTTEITGATENSIKVAKSINLPYSVFKET